MVNNLLTVTFGVVAVRSYFGGRLVGQQLGVNIYEPVIQDRLGSVGKYYPYGEERNSPQLPNDQVKFATYTRDSATGNDYADQRYYTSTLGRFMTPDPYRSTPSGAATLTDPGTWNHYAYTSSEPINRADPTGQDICDPEDLFDSTCLTTGGSLGEVNPAWFVFFTNLAAQIAAQVRAQLLAIAPPECDISVYRTERGIRRRSARAHLHSGLDSAGGMASL